MTEEVEKKVEEPCTFHIKVEAALEWTLTKNKPKVQLLFYLNKPEAAFEALN